MRRIDTFEIPDEFQRAWNASGLHIESQVQGQVSWIRAHLHQPLVDHLSFRLGNQIFAILIDAIRAGQRFFPITQEGMATFLKWNKQANAIPCVLKMQFDDVSGESVPSLGEWGLTHAETWEAVRPFDLVTDEKIEMSDWELHDFAVQVVRDDLVKKGVNVTSWQSILDLDPAIWCRDGDALSWVPGAPATCLSDDT